MRQDLSSDHLLEIRYRPMGAFLNIRGEIADFFCAQGLFLHWRISDNRVDFWNMEDSQDDPEKAYVSFRNCGYERHNPDSHSYFADRAAKFVSVLDDFPEFNYPPVKRLGIRARFYRPVENLDFEELRTRYFTKFIKDPATNVFGGKLEDVGVNLNFREKETFFNIVSGPMKKEQFVKDFSRLADKDDVGQIGIFFDIDLFKVDLGAVSTRALIGEIKSLHQKSWQRLGLLEAYLEI